MGFFGHYSLPATSQTASADSAYTSVVTMPERGRVGYVSAWIENPTGAPVLVRPVIYAAPLGLLVASGDPVSIPAGKAPGWVELLLGDVPVLADGDYEVGVQAAGAVKLGYTASAGTSHTWSDTFSDGPIGDAPGGATSQARDYAFWVHYRTLEDIADDLDDELYAELGWASSQEMLSATPVVPNSAVQATCGWHGISYDSKVGAFAIVRTGGPLADLVGERLKITADDQVIYVSCRDERDIVEDISLSRAAFARVALLWTEDLDVLVEVLS
jgi:hypothetical protein